MNKKLKKDLEKLRKWQTKKDIGETVSEDNIREMLDKTSQLIF